MPRVYRLSNAKFTHDRGDLVSGAGARLFGGRWNHKGTALLYTAPSIALAVLEVLVHSSVLPKNMVLVAYDVPAKPGPDVWPITALPSDWAVMPAPKSTQDRGTAWARAGKKLAVTVPSVVVPLEANWLLNPNHPDIAKVKTSVIGTFPFDARLR